MTTAKTEALDLSPFCLPPDDPSPRYDLTAPWRADGKIYATDGHTLIECVGGNATPDPVTEGRWPNVWEALEDFPEVCSETMPELEKRPSGLDNWGRLMQQCELCCGSGKHQCDCEYCSGDCGDCDGNGEYMQTHPRCFTRVEIDGLPFELGMLWLIAKLPDLRIKVVCKRDRKDNKPYLFFNFAGGRGVHVGLVINQ